MLDTRQIKGFFTSLHVNVMLPANIHRGVDFTKDALLGVFPYSFFATARTVDLGISSISSLYAMSTALRYYHQRLTPSHLLVTMEHIVRFN